MQDNMQQDELANLLSGFSIGNATREPVVTAPVPEPVPSPPSEPQSIIYSSMHYTHSAHVAPRAQSEPSSTHVDSSELEAILVRNSIDPAQLSLAQATLFKNADDDQRLRLLELWRISPPRCDGQEQGMLSETNLHQEETLARIRYERLQQDAQQAVPRTLNEPSMWSENEQMMEDDTAVVGASPAVSAAAQMLTSGNQEDGQRNAEPYILSGYESLAKRDYDESARSLRESTRYNQAVDPVYDKSTSCGLWGSQDMENQYGAYAASREYGYPYFTGIHGMEEDMIM